MSFALICMCCSAGCYCSVHVQVALHVQVHVLVVCRCSAWAVAYVIRVQLPGISWSLYVYDCRSLLHCLFFVRRCFCTFSFLFATFYFYFLFFFLAPMYNSFESITSRHVDQWRWLVDDCCLTVSVMMSSDGLQGGFYDVIWLVAFVLGLVTRIRRFSCLTMSLLMRIGRIQGGFLVVWGHWPAIKG